LCSVFFNALDYTSTIVFDEGTARAVATGNDISFLLDSMRFDNNFPIIHIEFMIKIHRMKIKIISELFMVLIYNI
jgi:hypothetical protein